MMQPYLPLKRTVAKSLRSQKSDVAAACGAGAAACDAAARGTFASITFDFLLTSLRQHFSSGKDLVSQLPTH